MARNRIPDAVDKLIASMDEAADGAALHGAALPLRINTEADIRADLLALAGDPADPATTPGAQALWLAAKSSKAAKTNLKKTADTNARVFISNAVKVLQPRLGNQWNSAWQAVGFSNGKLSIPTTENGRFGLLGSLKAYFTANPTFEVAALNVSAAAAQSLQTAFSTARQASNQSNAQSGAAKAARDAAQAALGTRMSNLIGELDQLLADADPIWHAFGLNAPADPETPEIPENVVFTFGSSGTGTLFVDWDDALRADRYHVFAQGPGDAAPVLRATVTDSDATLTGLPLGQTLIITVKAVNEAGESLPSTGVNAVLP